MSGNANSTYNDWSVGRNYTGVAYNWGGFDMVEQFKTKINNGVVAGNNKLCDSMHIYTNFAGVDCSGFVSRCWELGSKESTNGLDKISTAISWTDLKQGDITNKPGSHTRLFDCFTEGTNQMYMYESTTGSYDKVIHRILPRYNSYTPIRYNNMVDDYSSPPVSTKFNSGDSIKTTADLNMRSGPGLSIQESKITTLIPNSTGQVLSDPGNGKFSYGYYWWYVQFGDKKGWCVENWLEKISAVTGNLNIYVKTWNGNLTSGAKVVYYKTDWTPIDVKTTDSNGKASWANIDTGKYHFEVYYNDEFWGSKENVEINSGQITEATIQRYMPYAESIVTKDTNNNSKTSFTLGETVQMIITVKNVVSFSNNAKATCQADRDKNSSYDYSSTSAYQSVSGNSTKEYLFYFTPTATGKYYIRPQYIYTYLNNKDILTDSWNWANSAYFEVTAPPTYSITGYVKDGSDNGISGVTVTLSGASNQNFTTGLIPYAAGYYGFLNLPSGNYTVTSSKTGYIFNPTSKSYNPLNGNQDNQNITGTYNPPPTTINISVTPSSINFGNVTVGQSSPNQQVVITNQSNSIDNLTGSIHNLSAPFSIVSGGGSFNLLPGNSRTVEICFSPTSVMQFSQNLQIIHNATNQTSPINISLSGVDITEQHPKLRIYPANMSFNIQQGTNPNSQNLTIYNDGQSNMSWTASSNANWLSPSSYSGIVSTGSSQNIQVFVNVNNLSPNTYQGRITITASGVENNPQYCDITLNISTPITDTPCPMFRHDGQHTGRSLYNGPNNPVLKWNYATKGNVLSSPAIGTDGTVFVGSSDKKLYALNPDGSLKWSYTTGGGVYSSSPDIGADGTVFVGSDNDKLYALNPDGSLKWSYTTGSDVSSSPAIGADGTVFVGSCDKKLYALNPDGSLKWSYTTGDSVSSSPAIGADGTVFVGSHDKKLYALNLDGSLKWSYTTGGSVVSSPAIGADGTVFVGSFDGKLYALNPDGSLKWSYTNSVYAFSSSPSIGIDGTVFVGLGDGKLYAIAEAGASTVISTPYGANIFLDGTNTGTVTPAILTGIIPGTHTIKLTKAGYCDWVGSITVAANQTSYLYGSLTVKEIITSVFHNITTPLKTSDVLNVTLIGQSNGTATFDIGTLTFSISMAETSPGTYTGAYTVKNGDNIKDAVVVGHLEIDGTTTSVNAALPITIDTLCPSTTDNAPSGWQKATVTVTLSPSDNLSGVSKTYYSINQKGWNEGTTASISAEGTNTLAYFSVDNADNTETTRTKTIKIDTTPPSTTDNAPSGWQKTDVIVILTTTDAVSGVAKTYYTTDGSTNFATGTTINLTVDGTYTIKYFSVDNAGNTETVKTAANIIKIDKTPPIVIIGTPTNGFILTATQTTLSGTVTGTDSNFGTLTHNNGTPSSLNIGGDSFTATLTLYSGRNVIVVSVQDQAGNVGSTTVIIEVVSCKKEVLPSQIDVIATATDNTSIEIINNPYAGTLTLTINTEPDKANFAVADQNLPKGVDISGLAEAVREFKLCHEDDITKGTTTGKFKITIPYSAAIMEDRAKGLRIFWMNPDTKKWELVGGIVDTTNHTVTVEVTHLSIFRVAILVRIPPQNIIVYPNPTKEGWITFTRLTERVSVRIFNMAGELVYGEQEHTANDKAEWTWDCKNNDGEKVASGVYIYTIQDSVSGHIEQGRFGVIK
ncbi:hypothetical protein CO110_01655 [Candidatus Desantisbacteria bacterium CG_4_9_14_3_um_filter_40_11]|uniref:SH3b domain-containing protein n=2 Tax=unclassified Candidatus Desantisiibacteriota TaxID=3106372 RepID=A0A2M8AVT7_9BACT|nr:MAG: hypothetical protein CO110_01655 [Candidatus Desantisbacteria bacterium CG_4_9_14_3_um_filter_40_11]